MTQAQTFHVTEISTLKVDSAITPATLDYLRHHFSKLPQDALVLIEVNTPGGLVTTTKDIITLIGAQNRPVAVWITPEGASAASAGAIIAASAHFILMSPGTNLGAATPVGLGHDIEEKDGRAKAMNDLKALVRSLSDSRGRPAKPFEDMIENAKSFTDREALELKIIDAIINHERGLIQILSKKSFSLRGKPTVLEFDQNPIFKVYEPTMGQKLLGVLADPSAAYFLFLIGLALIYFEFQAPGGYIAGGVGISFLILAAISFQVLPLDWGALALMLLGAALLILEIYVVSYGLLAIGGLGAFIAGSLFLFHGEEGFISVNHSLLLSTLLGVLVAGGIVVWYLLKNKNTKAAIDFFLPVGSQGSILTKNSDAITHYQIKVRGEIWKASSTEELAVNDLVEVISVNSELLIAEIKKITKE